ncbi:MAG: Mu-like prophage major head subunit gpT family protein, partial [Planctomycetes bacterium]|nr:Mu-like prophage major head subunit gpT family protein [Planctomycetota bacterium]
MSRALNYRQLKRFYDLDPRRTCDELLEGVQQGHLRVEELSLRGLFEALVEDGRKLVQLLDPRQSGGTSLVEAAGAVDTSAFSNITGQIVYSKALESFRDPAFLWPQLVETVPTQLSGEKIPGIGRIGDQAETIGEGQPYPLAGLSEEYVETPETAKRGFIVPVTKEAIFFDRTGLVLRRAAEVARWLGVNKEKRVLDVVLGVENPYKRNGVENDTYLSSGDWVNIKATNALEDWTDIEAAELLLDGMSDPNTGEPIAIMPDTLIVPTALKHTARRIVRAVSIAHVDNTAAADTVRTTSTNP